VNRGIQFVIENDLCDPGAVAQVDEDDLAQVAAPVDPSHEHNFLASVRETKLSAHVRSFEIAEKIKHFSALLCGNSFFENLVLRKFILPTRS
jgi:hypothetical protein